jgi:hypothetical protein
MVRWPPGSLAVSVWSCTKPSVRPPAQKIQLLFAVAGALLTVVAFEAAYFTRLRLLAGER